VRKWSSSGSIRQTEKSNEAVEGDVVGQLRTVSQWDDEAPSQSGSKAVKQWAGRQQSDIGRGGSESVGCKAVENEAVG
jgi:hypothetical protein